MALYRILPAASLLSLTLSALASIGPVTDLNITNIIVAPDGNVSRGAVAANGAVPGPVIAGNKGDNFQINVNVDLTNSTMLKTTSIHWHGIFQKDTNWDDGGAFVSQCPIASNNSFLYNFTVPDQAGTYWYHSHLSTQYCDGLRGPMIIYDPDDPYLADYDLDDDSTVITLSDWYHTVAPVLETGVPTSDATLINGLGRYIDGNASELAVVSVTQGKRYRFRLINMACDPNFTFQIDSHNFTIIEVDGVNHEALPVDEIQIFAAQRYSIILEANQTIDNYWIRANPNNGNQGFEGGINSAILRYVGADAVEPTTTQDTATNALNETNLVPLDDPGVTGCKEVDCADVNLNLEFSFSNGTFFVNDVAFSSPTVPVLLQILSGTTSAADLLPSGSVYGLPKNSTIQISMPSGGVAGGPHPLHLHGHTFDVIRSAGQTDYNFDTPPRRDTVSIGSDGDNVTIRFTTDNVGPWFLHCHIDWHLQDGFAVVMAEDIDDVSSDIDPTTQWDNLCTTYDN